MPSRWTSRGWLSSRRQGYIECLRFWRRAGRRSRPRTARLSPSRAARADQYGAAAAAKPAAAPAKGSLSLPLRLQLLLPRLPRLRRLPLWMRRWRRRSAGSRPSKRYRCRHRSRLRKDGRVTKGDMLAAIEKAASAPTPVNQRRRPCKCAHLRPPTNAARESA